MYVLLVHERTRGQTNSASKSCIITDTCTSDLSRCALTWHKCVHKCSSFIQNKNASVCLAKGWHRKTLSFFPSMRPDNIWMDQSSLGWRMDIHPFHQRPSVQSICHKSEERMDGIDKLIFFFRPSIPSITQWPISTENVWLTDGQTEISYFFSYFHFHLSESKHFLSIWATVWLTEWTEGLTDGRREEENDLSVHLR